MGNDPVRHRQVRHGFIIPSRQHETNNQTAKRESLSEKPLKIAPQAEEERYNKKNRINPVHRRGPVSRMRSTSIIEGKRTEPPMSRHMPSLLMTDIQPDPLV